MIVLTYDTDHMSQSMMEIFVEHVLPNDLNGTIFCTQPYPLLARLSNIEVAAHPYLSNSESWINTTKALLSKLEETSGTIRGVRAHSCAYSQVYGIELNDIGIQYVSQSCIPWELPLPIYRHPWGIYELPIRFMDNTNLWAHQRTTLNPTQLSQSIIDFAICSQEVFCFDFHPIHLLLNTTDFRDYETWRRQGNPDIKWDPNTVTYGIRNFYLDLLASIRRSNTPTASAADAVASSIAGSKPVSVA